MNVISAVDEKTVGYGLNRVSEVDEGMGIQMEEGGGYLYMCFFQTSTFLSLFLYSARSGFSFLAKRFRAAVRANSKYVDQGVYAVIHGHNRHGLIPSSVNSVGPKLKGWSVTRTHGMYAKNRFQTTRLHVSIMVG